MAHSKVGICNVSLASLGAASIRDFDEDNKRSRQSSIFYDIVRDYLLTKFDWPFARVYKELNAVVIAVSALPYKTKAFALPNDCRAPRVIQNLDAPHTAFSRNTWEIMGDKLYTAIDHPGLYYTAQEINVNLFSDTFANLLALGISVRLAPSISQDAKLTAVLAEQFAKEQPEAWAADANIGNSYQVQDGDPMQDTFVNPDLALPMIIT